MPVDVKICGLTEETGLRAAIEGGARYVGFVFCQPSRRFIRPAQAAPLFALIPPEVTSVGLFLDASDEEIRSALAALPSLGLLQLHGLETPARAAEIRALTGKPVMKAIHVATADDLAAAHAYEDIADGLLFDTKTGPAPTGGTGQSFEWTLLKNRLSQKPWMLAGGLSLDNLAQAVRDSGAKIVDVSSGVETGGRKDPGKIRAFLEKARNI